jgi:hypothetical protein
MKPLTKQQLKTIFKKVKHFRPPKDLDEINFDQLTYLGWIDTTDMVAYTVYNYKGKPEGIRWQITQLTHKPLHLAFCEICRQQRPRGHILFVSSKTRKLSKGINYRTRGNYICSNFDKCNHSIKDHQGIEKLFRMIIEEN